MGPETELPHDTTPPANPPATANQPPARNEPRPSLWGVELDEGGTWRRCRQGRREWFPMPPEEDFIRSSWGPGLYRLLFINRKRTKSWGPGETFEVAPGAPGEVDELEGDELEGDELEGEGDELERELGPEPPPPDLYSVQPSPPAPRAPAPRAPAQRLPPRPSPRARPRGYGYAPAPLPSPSRGHLEPYLAGMTMLERTWYMANEAARERAEEAERRADAREREAERRWAERTEEAERRAEQRIREDREHHLALERLRAGQSNNEQQLAAVRALAAHLEQRQAQDDGPDDDGQQQSSAPAPEPDPIVRLVELAAPIVVPLLQKHFGTETPDPAPSLGSAGSGSVSG